MPGYPDPAMAGAANPVASFPYGSAIGRNRDYFHPIRRRRVLFHNHFPLDRAGIMLDIYIALNYAWTRSRLNGAAADPDDAAEQRRRQTTIHQYSLLFLMN